LKRGKPRNVEAEARAALDIGGCSAGTATRPARS
jgi:hypothetical protein